MDVMVFTEPIVIRHAGQRHDVRFVSEAAAIAFTWPARLRRLRACEQALEVALDALTNPSAQATEAARIAFRAAAKAAHVLEP